MWKYYDKGDCHNPADFVKCQMRSAQDHNATVLDFGPFQITPQIPSPGSKRSQTWYLRLRGIATVCHDAQYKDAVFSVTDTHM
jgi:hypothetical protein